MNLIAIAFICENVNKYNINTVNSITVLDKEKKSFKFISQFSKFTKYLGKRLSRTCQDMAIEYKHMMW